MINYTAIPDRSVSHPWTPWDALRWAVLITFSILGVIAVGGLATIHNKHQDDIMAVISGLMLVCFLGIILKAFAGGYRLFKRQRLWMKAFAHDNGWHYDDRRRTVSEISSFPPSLYQYIDPRLTSVRFTISGQVNGIPFELAYITYVQQVGVIGRALMGYRSRLAWLTVLQSSGPLPVDRKPDLLYEQDGTSSYITSQYNVLYLDETRQFLENGLSELSAAPALAQSTLT